MIINGIEIVVEYIALVLCLCRFLKIEFRINGWVILGLSVDLIVMYGIEVGVLPNNSKILINGTLIIIGWFVSHKNIVHVLYKYMLTVATMFMLQFVYYYIVKAIVSLEMNTIYKGIIVNVCVLITVMVWKEKYVHNMLRLFEKKKVVSLVLIILYIICFTDILYTINKYNKKNGIQDKVTVLIFVTILITGLFIALLKHWSNGRKEKEKESILYEKYTHSFETAINDMKIRQHTFDNQINAIKGINYINDKTSMEQEEYCQSILYENKYNKLLIADLQPIIKGFLYTKFIEMEEKDIQIEYHIESCFDNNRVKEKDIIEVLGILLDNAKEAVEKREEPRKVQVVLYGQPKLILQVSNNSPVIPNNELEKFCNYGYSNKGKNRGVGLFRVKSIAEKYQADLVIENKEYDENYISFTLRF